MGRHRRLGCCLCSNVGGSASSTGEGPGIHQMPDNPEGASPEVAPHANGMGEETRHQRGKGTQAEESEAGRCVLGPKARVESCPACAATHRRAIGSFDASTLG